MIDHPRPDLDSVRSIAAQIAKGLHTFHGKEMLHQVLRAELPLWLDGVLQKASYPHRAKRQAALSEFIHDLHTPAPQFQRLRAPPLVERNPVVFWQGVALVLGLAVVVLLGLRGYGH